MTSRSSCGEVRESMSPAYPLEPAQGRASRSRRSPARPAHRWWSSWPRGSPSSGPSRCRASRRLPAGSSPCNSRGDKQAISAWVSYHYTGGREPQGQFQGPPPSASWTERRPRGASQAAPHRSANSHVIDAPRATVALDRRRRPTTGSAPSDLDETPIHYLVLRGRTSRRPQEGWPSSFGLLRGSRHTTQRDRRVLEAKHTADLRSNLDDSEDAQFVGMVGRSAKLPDGIVKGLLDREAALPRPAGDYFGFRRFGHAIFSPHRAPWVPL